MTILRDVKSQHDDLDDQEFKALHHELVAPRYIIDAKYAGNHAHKLHDQELKEARQVEWSEELVRIPERRIESCCSTEFRIEQPVHFEIDNKSEEANRMRATFVVSDPVPESQVIHDLLTEHDEEEEVDGDSEHQCEHHHVDYWLDTKVVSEVKHDTHSPSFDAASKDNEIGDEARLAGLALGDGHDKRKYEEEGEHGEGDLLVGAWHASCLVVVQGIG